jgi:hypothetical protein
MVIMLKGIPWDWSGLLESSKDGNLLIEEKDIICKINNTTIEVLKIKLNITSVVYEKASADEIIEGFEELKSTFGFQRVLKALVTIMLVRIRISKRSDISLFEPEVIDFLKICYWYNRIKSISSIKHRTKEIRSRLSKRLLYKLEKNKRTIDYSNLSDAELENKIAETLGEIRRAQSHLDQNERLRLLNEYLNSINVCISELMFAAIARQSNFVIDFGPTNNNYDYDIIIDGHPCQIKTLFSYDMFPISESDISKQKAYYQRFKELQELYDANQIEWSFVKGEVIKYIKSDCFDKINDALRQKAQIIILDGTRTIPGRLLNYYYTDDSIFVKINDSFIESLKNSPNDFVSIIFASTSYDNKFRISSVVVKVPVRNVNQVYQVNEIRLDETYIVSGHNRIRSY